MRLAQDGAKIQHYVTQFEMTNFLNEDMLDHLELFRFPVYTNVYTEQDEQHVLYLLVEGQVQCYHYHLSGKLAVFAISTPFAAIGDLEILSEERVHSNVTATRDTTMLGIASEWVDRYGANDPRFLRFLIEQLRQKLYQTNALQINQLLPLKNRLVVYILSQVADNQDYVILPSDKEDLASLLGATSRHLNRVLKELVESGSISSGYPRIQILDRHTLRALAQ